MSDITEQAKAKARELLSLGHHATFAALETSVARYIQQVSDAAKEASKGKPGCLAPFILPEPVTIESQVRDIFADGWDIWKEDIAAKLIAELPKRGLKIVEAPSERL